MTGTNEARGAAPIDGAPSDGAPSDEAAATTDVEQHLAAGGKPRSKAELRVRKYAGSDPPPPVSLFRARNLAGELMHGDDGTGEPQLTLAAGALGEAELALGRADPQAAIAIVDGSEIPDADKRGVRARAALMSGKIGEARAALDGVRDDARCAVADAALALAEGETPRASRRIADALFDNPTGLAERYLFALVKVAEGDMVEAQTALGDVARCAPSHAVARFQLGQLMQAAGDPARAGTLFEMAWSLAPTFTAPALSLAEMLADSRQYGEALNLLGAVTEAAPEALAPRMLQLRVLLEIGERDAALTLATVLHDRLPDEIEVTLLFAEALSECERRDEATTVLERVLADGALATALADAPNASPQLLAVAQRARRQLARLALAERPPRGADAVALLRSAAELPGPFSSELALELFHMAISLAKRGDAERALEIVQDRGDASALISGAILARSHAMWDRARALAEAARRHIAGSQAESQIDAFLASLP